jgi:hypothetical protein
MNDKPHSDASKKLREGGGPQYGGEEVTTREPARFQFTVAAIFRSIFFAAVCISWFTVPHRITLPVYIAWTLTSFACGGAAVGTLFGRTLLGTVIGAVIGLVVFCYFVLPPAVGS